MADLPRDQLAAVAKTADDLDAVLDKLFANVAELKAVLGRVPPPQEEGKSRGE